MTGMQVNLADYYHWDEPSRGMPIYLQSAMADRLQSDLAGAGEQEIGGVLLGRRDTEPGGALYIQDFIAVPSSHSTGAFYELSGQDTAALETVLLRTALQAAASDSALPVIGYFRSHHRDGLSLSPSDESLIESYFEKPDSVFLLIKTTRGSKACTAGFFFWEDGRLQAEFSALEVALGGVGATSVDDPAEVPEYDAALPEPLPELAAVAEPEPVAVTRRIIPDGKNHFWRDFFLRAAIVSLAAISVVFTVLTYLGVTRSPRESAAAPVPAAALLGLDIKRDLAGVQVVWNQEAPEIVAAHRALLFIRDEERQKILELDKTQLATGSVLYTPAGDDVQFRLEVESGGHSVAQSVRLLLPQTHAKR